MKILVLPDIEGFTSPLCFCRKIYILLYGTNVLQINLSELKEVLNMTEYVVFEGTIISVEMYKKIMAEKKEQNG